VPPTHIRDSYLPGVFAPENAMFLPDFKEKDSQAITENFKIACSKAKMRVTPQRLRIYRQLLRSNDHPTAETLFKKLRQEMPKISLDTVYRTLGIFEASGLICRLKTVQSPARFDANMEQHHHFICNSCNEVIDFDWSGFDNSILPDEIINLGTITARSVNLSGLCGKCSGKIGKRDNLLCRY
jgi:Fur family transcriptional regulator, peroxide stress response regulator